MSRGNTNISALVRPNIAKLSPYTSARDEYKGNEGVFLDANENPFGRVNRYPDPYQKELKQVISEIKGGSTEQLFLGNGSDEAIDLAYRIFCEPNRDKAIVFTPTYGMYEVYANINAVELITLPLDSLFQIDTTLVESYLSDESVKLMFICSPNNPTGNLMDRQTIVQLLEQFKGIIILDEAYIDFSTEASWLEQLSQYNNLIILQTLSKGWGMAGLRIGMAWMSEELLYYFNKVKSPYNLSVINQQQAIEVLRDTEGVKQRIELLLSEKDRVTKELKNLSIVKVIYPSEANYLLVEFDNANQIYEELISRQIIVRNRSKVVPNTLRISIGLPEENNLLLAALKAL
ncbi:histidinol-phosphate transaminase [Myroides marinus]|uniref:Histidinol-phosphate aminotransferase n=1 Tax=Myroides marinus TaxID=703342 RepID=A0A1H6XBF0_9FLAO|nr:histidinol-phosphate transaminase [Myroides marinus]MDM1378034.1 histidinol-phosphate transaminase [Myroides marinus]MDM1385305.1 histidinol-phosphate transaminase [Myroides marinus]MDM1392518.1 histidinol-phosphate transaminase [Myroides marinus]MDM1503739.1 histidinol-phosphate transaminase [Myroides marinus]SEJ22172.1 histidinol-phosphate aminotransferase [Myroides marinus]